jgi:hypothetical protein
MRVHTGKYWANMFVCISFVPGFKKACATTSLYLVEYRPHSRLDNRDGCIPRTGAHAGTHPGPQTEANYPSSVTDISGR